MLYKGDMFDFFFDNKKLDDKNRVYPKFTEVFFSKVVKIEFVWYNILQNEV